MQVIEDGLRLIGRQMPVPGIGRADIVALDQQNNLVVIEVKSGTADDSTLTQLLSYMHGLKCKENREIRGIIVAEEFTRKLKQAATGLPNIKLVKITIEKTENTQNTPPTFKLKSNPNKNNKMKGGDILKPPKKWK